MDKAILFPSPNWFHVSGMAVSSDGWVFYGGPARALYVLLPLPPEKDLETQEEDGPKEQGYHVHVVQKAHAEKIISVHTSPEWPSKRVILTGSQEGTVKQWNIDYDEDNEIKVKSNREHDAHRMEHEDLVGIGYANEVFAITVGCFGNVVKWNLSSNLVQIYYKFLKSFKPTCMACSPHKTLQVAIGTKQGVIFHLDLSGEGKILYKIRAHDEEINNLSWCPQYEVTVEKVISKCRNLITIKRESDANAIDSASTSMDKTRNKQESDENGAKASIDSDNKATTSETSGNESEVEEEDLFDMYKDNEADEFGHKKYKPEEILVKVDKDEKKETDYLVECLKLKDEILKRKNDSEPSIESLVEALDKTHVNGEEENKKENIKENDDIKEEIEISVPKVTHTQRHLLASISKTGLVHIWSKRGLQMATCNPMSIHNKQKQGKSWKPLSCLTLLWYTPDVLLLSDHNGQLLQCNPLSVSFKGKFEWRLVHGLHRRCLYGIASGVPRKQTSTLDMEYPVWSISQDRILVQYSLQRECALTVNTTCGGFIYMVANCPYDANKLGVGVGDGAVRVCSSGQTTVYWQNVQGKLLMLAWHPTQENLLAFSTAEARVGLIDTSSRSERPARVLGAALGSAVYGLAWAGDALYACGGGTLVRYGHYRQQAAAEPVKVVVEGSVWQVTDVCWRARALLVGSSAGGVGALGPAVPHTVLAVAFPFTKMIYCIDWHPEQVSSSTEESPHKNWIAVCSSEKHITVLELLENEEGDTKLVVQSTLTGHTGSLTRVTWSPHVEGQLLSASQDHTVRVWSVASGVCLSIFSGHSHPVMSATWVASPTVPHRVLSGGGDCCLRLWDPRDYPAQAYLDGKSETKKERRSRSKKKTEPDVPVEVPYIAGKMISANMTDGWKPSRKFLYPIITKQITSPRSNGCRKLLDIYIAKREENQEEIQSEDNEKKPQDFDTDYIKMFGNINEVNEILDMEQERHTETGNVEAWVMAAMFRGRVDDMIRYACERDALCPFLVSLAPCVSYKFWKETSQLYMTQIDRLRASCEEEKLFASKRYGGSVYRKASVQLSVHDVVGAVDTMCGAHLYKEAYLMCRARHMESVARRVLTQWADRALHDSAYTIAAAVSIALEELPRAANILCRSTNEDYLELASRIAKVAGQTHYADCIAEKQKKLNEIDTSHTTEQILAELPDRLQLLLEEREGEAGEREGEAGGRQDML